MPDDTPLDLRVEGAAAPLALDADRPRFTWRLPDEVPAQAAYRLRVAGAADSLAGDDPTGDVLDTGWVEGSAPAHVADLSLDRDERYYWTVAARTGDGETTADADPATFRTGLGASWDADWIGGPGGDDAAAPRLRTAFSVSGDVERATLYAGAAGTCVLRCNGERVGDRALDPALTDYEERVRYAADDVTDRLREGQNVVGAVLGRERYALTSENTWGWHDPAWADDRPLLRLELVVEYADGTTETVTTGPDWETAPSATTFDSLYEGEHYDARRADPGWTDPDADDDWEAAAVRPGPDGEMAAQRVQPMRAVRTVDPADVDRLDGGARVVDFGEMVAGRVRLVAEGPRGADLELVHGEKRHEDGTVDVDQPHVDGQIQTDRYVLAGDGPESWTPRFSYKGFRYVEVRGADACETVDLTAEVVHTTVEAGDDSDFGCSDELLDRIHDNTRRALLNNHHGQPTDTPVFEKNGWTGDAQLTAPAALYNFDMGRFYRKWLADFADAQRPDGEVPPIVPTSDWGYSDAPHGGAILSPNPAWDAAYVLVPWWVYRHLGDRRFLRDHFEGAAALVDYLGGYAEDGVLDEGLGDWLAPGHGELRSLPPEGQAITGTAYYARLAGIVSAWAAELGRADDAERFAAVADDARAAFEDRFYDPDRGYYRTGEVEEYRQTSNVLPLAFDLVPDDRVDGVVDSLVRDVRETHDGHLNTGILGTKYLLPVLTEYGHADLAYEVATQTTYPSWGHWIEDGATALYEAWELESRSLDHHMYGSVDQWFYEDLAGLRPVDPGYGRFEVAPAVPTDLDAAGASVETPRGTVGATWEDGVQFALQVEVAPTTRATVAFPGDRTVGRANGRDPESYGDDRLARREDGTLDVGPGSWLFTE